MNIFYDPKIDGDFFTLNPTESMHCVKVLRQKKNDLIMVMDGKGGCFRAEIIDDNWKACKLKILEVERDFEPLPYYLELAVAPTKNIDRFEWLLEKATEIGVSKIVPLICHHSERRKLRMDRMEKVVISAMKQSVKAYMPELLEPQHINDWVSECECSTKFIAHCEDSPKEYLWKKEMTDSIAIAIGPEGDFSSNELVLAEENDFNEISLGEYRLRTETAGVVACSSVYMAKI